MNGELISPIWNDEFNKTGKYKIMDNKYFDSIKFPAMLLILNLVSFLSTDIKTLISIIGTITYLMLIKKEIQLKHHTLKFFKSYYRSIYTYHKNIALTYPLIIPHIAFYSMLIRC